MTLPAKYKKLTATRHSRVFREAVEVQEVPLAQPADGELVIRNRYAGVNASDVLMAAGRYLVPTPVPCDLGAEAVGEIVAVGDNVGAYQPGEFVLLNGIGLGYREYNIVPARRAVPIPFASPEVMSLSIGGLTASIALEITGEMTTGETVLVTAAAGGTGAFAVQLAKIAGCHVIGTCGSDQKAAVLRQLGCDRVVNYREEQLRDVLAAEYPHGVDVVFDGVGGTMFDTALDFLAPFGRLLAVGAISEYGVRPEPVTGQRVYYKLLGKMASIRGFNLNRFIGRPELAEHMMKLIGLLNTGQLNPLIDPSRFIGVEAAIDAVEYLHAGKNTGKVVVSF